MGDLLTSLIRTYVPLIVGGAIAWLSTKGIDIDENTKIQLVSGLTSLISAVYYTLVRLLESKWAVFGLLLGSQKTPKY